MDISSVSSFEREQFVHFKPRLATRDRETVERRDRLGVTRQAHFLGSHCPASLQSVYFENRLEERIASKLSELREFEGCFLTSRDNLTRLSKTTSAPSRRLLKGFENSRTLSSAFDIRWNLLNFLICDSVPSLNNTSLLAITALE